MIKRFVVTVARVTEVTVEIDTDSFDAAAMEQFRRDYYPIYSYADHAKNIAGQVVDTGDYEFVEGYGRVKYQGRPPTNRSNAHSGKTSSAYYNINIDDVDDDEPEIEVVSEEDVTPSSDGAE